MSHGRNRPRSLVGARNDGRNGPLPLEGAGDEDIFLFSFLLLLLLLLLLILLPQLELIGLVF